MERQTNLNIISFAISALTVILLAMLGIGIANNMNENRPVEDFYQLTQPLILNSKVYPTCGDHESDVTMFARTERTATVNTSVVVRKELFRLNNRGDILEEQETGVRVETYGNTTSGTRNIVIAFEYPCSILEPGRYIWRNIHSLDIRGNTVEYASETETFLVDTPENIDRLVSQ